MDKNWHTRIYRLQTDGQLGWLDGPDNYSEQLHTCFTTSETLSLKLGSETNIRIVHSSWQVILNKVLYYIFYGWDDV